MGLDLLSSLGLFLFEPGEVTAGPLLLAFIGIVAIAGAPLILGTVLDRNKNRGKLKYLSAPLFAIAAYWGWHFFAYSQESQTLKLELVGGTSLTAYRVIFWGPVLLAVASLIFAIYWDKFRRDDEVF